MKQIILLVLSFFTYALVFAQPGKKNSQQQKPPSQTDINKMMDEATKGMSPEEKEEMKKSLGGVMNDMMKQPQTIANYPEFTSNKQLVPKRDVARINAIPKKKLVQADMGGYAGNLYNKIMTKGDAAEIVIVKKVIAQTPAANDMGSAAVLCMMQGHPQAAMALSMKAVQANPTNVNAQNNMASLLTQYGYPEQAIPVLQKLQTQFPENSTVLNNMAMAWLGLGETDSVRFFAAKAMQANPENPDAMLCGGLMEELFGDPIKATEHYVKAMENAPNGFTHEMIKNKDGGTGLEKIDYEKMIKSITIYNYFPNDWIKVPVLSDKVSGFKSDKRIQNGYEKMREALEEKLETLASAGVSKLVKDVPETADPKAEAEAVAKIMNDFSKGVNIMSKTAITVMSVLQEHMVKWEKDFTKERSELFEKLNKEVTEMRKCKDCKCPAMDAKNTNSLAYANPIIREFYAKKINEFRTWLNAFCTWVWYIDGNPRDVAITHCFAWTNYLFSLYSAAVSEQRLEPPTCIESNTDDAEFFAEPTIPNFTCPTIVKIPMGKEWQGLGKGVKNFDNNKYKIPQAGQIPIPNTSIAYSASKGFVAQPGADPSTKTANGSASVNNRMTNAEAQAYHTETMQMLNDLPNFKDWQHRKNMKIISDLKPWAQIMAEKALMKKLTTSDCDKIKDNNNPKIGELKFEYWNPKSKKNGNYSSDEEFAFETGIAEITENEDGTKTYKYLDGTVIFVDGEGKNVFIPEIGEVTFVEDNTTSNVPETNTKSSPDIINTPADFKTVTNKQLNQFKQEYTANGLMPTLSSALQMPNLFQAYSALFK
jgi:tetratricopeptide (TPR) repeat protein